MSQGFPGGSEVKVSACSAGDLGSIPGLRRYPGEENGNPLQYSCLENPTDRGAWWATVHGVAKSQTQLSYFTHSLTHSLRFVIAYLSRSKCLNFMDESPSAVILEPKKIKSVTPSTFPPSMCHDMMGLNAMILVF